MTSEPEHHHFHLVSSYRRHMVNPRRERAFLHAAGFTLGSAGCRITTHAIRAGRGPFKNMSVGGRHLHHCTFGILAQIGIGYLWTYQLGLGTDHDHRSASRATAFASGLATAVTLDEFALWFDLADDYWTPAGRKSIDAILLFGGISVMGVAGRGLLHECGRAGRVALRELRL